MIQLTYGHTNTFLIEGSIGFLLVDTDYAGKLSAFYQAIKQHRIKVKDIAFVMATHYHPDHMGLISELMKQGVKLLLIDVQKSAVHFSDVIFDRDGIAADPIDETQATIISCEESRSFLRNIGIAGQIVHTPSHSEDSVSLILDDGRFFVGDLEPFEFIESYTDNDRLRKDWKTLLSFKPQKIHYAHRPEREL
ncbi:MAG: MBL fold metallo-hydrolase [Eubacteriaceae bacterium]|nr:MBL fold metallo-hydrolase [Eubacteriaceae bacterium]